MHWCTHYLPWIPIHVQLQSFVLNVHHKHQWFSQHYVFHVISLQACGWVNMGTFQFNLWKSICSNELCLIVLYRYTDEWQLLVVIHWKIPSPNFPSDSIYNITHTILQQFFASIFRSLPPSLFGGLALGLFWGLSIIPISLLWLQPW